MHPRGHLVDSMSPQFPPVIERGLRSLGVELILEDRVSSFENGQAKLASGKTVACDLYLPCNPAGGYGAAFMPASAVNPKGFIKVNSQFAVEVCVQCNVSPVPAVLVF